MAPEPSGPAVESTTAVAPRLTVFGTRTGSVIVHGTVVVAKAMYVRRLLMSRGLDRILAHCPSRIWVPWPGRVLQFFKAAWK